MRIKSILAAAALSVSVLATAPAHAVFVTGTFTPTDGLTNDFTGATTSIVSGLTSFGLGPAFVVTSCSPLSTFALDGCPPGGTTSNQPINYGTGGTFITYDGIAFNITSFGPVGTTAFTCDGTFCHDQITFTMSGGTVAGAFEASQFLWSFTATGTCLDNGLGACAALSAGGSWSGSVTATGTPVQTPEPGTLALLGLGLAGLGFASRRKKI
jgi:hypothetical protein